MEEEWKSECHRVAADDGNMIKFLISALSNHQTAHERMTSSTKKIYELTWLILLFLVVIADAVFKTLVVVVMSAARAWLFVSKATFAFAIVTAIIPLLLALTNTFSLELQT